MPSKIKLIIDENTALCDISGDKMELTAMIARLFLRQEHLKELFLVAIQAVEVLEDNIKKPKKDKQAEDLEKES
jgi:hypothetical protein